MARRKAKVLLGVTGGIAAYKSAEIVRALQKENCDVRVVMTESATKFVAPLTFQALTGHQVGVSMFDNPQDPIPHISLGQSCDLFLIAPCTANTAAKIAHGFADDLLTSTALACNAPLVVAPAANDVMYLNPATQENLEKLRAHGVFIIEAASGYLACGDTGVGRLPEIDYIVAYAMQILEDSLEEPSLGGFAAEEGEDEDDEEDDEDDHPVKPPDIDIGRLKAEANRVHGRENNAAPTATPARKRRRPSEPVGFDEIFELADRIEAGLIDFDDADLLYDAIAASEAGDGLTEEQRAFRRQDTQPIDVEAVREAASTDLRATSLRNPRRAVTVVPSTDPDGHRGPDTGFNANLVSGALAEAMSRTLTDPMPDSSREVDPFEPTPAAPVGGKPEDEEIARKGKPLSGRSVVVTAGPTVEPIDSVRFVSNYSSGKMGYAIAAAAQEAGAHVTLITGPVSIDAPDGVQVLRVTTAEEMFDAAKSSCISADISIFAAAVADMRPEHAADHKLKKGIDDEALGDIKLVKNPDILAAIGELKSPEQVVVGFAAETDDVVENARKKLASKHADMIVANDVGGGKVFGKDEDKAIFVTENTEIPLPAMSKEKLAKLIVARSSAILTRKRMAAREEESAS